MAFSRAHTATKAQQSPIITIKQTPGKTNPVLCNMIRLHVTITQSCDPAGYDAERPS